MEKLIRKFSSSGLNNEDDCIFRNMKYLKNPNSTYNSQRLSSFTTYSSTFLLMKKDKELVFHKWKLPGVFESFYLPGVFESFY